MGLLIISSLVKDKLKGNLEIRSKKGKGTTIEFDLKLNIDTQWGVSLK